MGWLPGLLLAGLMLAVRPVDQTLNEAILRHRSGVEVEGQGVIIKVFPDDTHGIWHQRFLLRLPSGKVVLVAHNLNLAPRIPGLLIGRTLRFHGQYEWNAKGGVIHWTHRDPGHRHPPGWIVYQGQTYR